MKTNWWMQAAMIMGFVVSLTHSGYCQVSRDDIEAQYKRFNADSTQIAGLRQRSNSDQEAVNIYEALPNLPGDLTKASLCKAERFLASANGDLLQAELAMTGGFNAATGRDSAATLLTRALQDLLHGNLKSAREELDQAKEELDDAEKDVRSAKDKLNKAEAILFPRV